MKINNIKKEIYELDGQNIGIYKIVIAKMPMTFSYMISSQILSKYNVEEIELYMSTYKDIFNYCRIIKDLLKKDSYIMELLINDKHELYNFLDGEHSIGKFYNNKILTEYLCKTMKLKNILT